MKLGGNLPPAHDGVYNRSRLDIPRDWITQSLTTGGKSQCSGWILMQTDDLSGHMPGNSESLQANTPVLPRRTYWHVIKRFAYHRRVCVQPHPKCTSNSFQAVTPWAQLEHMFAVSPWEYPGYGATNYIYQQTIICSFVTENTSGIPELLAANSGSKVYVNKRHIRSVDKIRLRIQPWSFYKPQRVVNGQPALWLNTNLPQSHNPYSDTHQ